MNVLAANIETERICRGYSKQELAAKLQITAEAYERYLSGEPIPGKQLLVLSRLFGRSVDSLLGLK
ncbi:MAG: helix-turn-helix domain-containing protein [Candidatus Howiella sp.]|jgi:transcriptional regulator with XRE-family HTH domain